MINQTSSLEFSHFPVMLSEIIQISNPKKGGLFVDCTFGGGGYSKALLQFDQNLKSSLKKEKLTTRDSRAVERKKYGHRKARRSFQFSKR